MGDCPDNHRAPVSALHHVLAIVKPRHEFMHHLYILPVLEASLIWVRGEAESRNGRSNDVKASCIKFWESFTYSLKRARPAILFKRAPRPANCNDGASK